MAAATLPLEAAGRKILFSRLCLSSRSAEQTVPVKTETIIRKLNTGAMTDR